MPFMRQYTWSPTQKKAARAAYDLALERELKSIRQEAGKILQQSGDGHAVWRLHDYLSKKRREVDQKYDYRYSVLMTVFTRLVSEGWLSLDELSGIGGEKVDVLKYLLSLE